MWPTSWRCISSSGRLPGAGTISSWKGGVAREKGPPAPTPPPRGAPPPGARRRAPAPRAGEEGYGQAHGECLEDLAHLVGLEELGCRERRDDGPPAGPGGHGPLRRPTGRA